MSENSLIQFLNQYDTEVELPSIGQKVSIKPITTGQMKKVLSYENADDPFVIENILDDIIYGCITTEGFNVDNLSLQDRFDLLIQIRKITKGKDYIFNIKCPECGTELINNIDIDKLETIPYPKKIDHKIKLTDNLTAYLTFVTRGMQKQAIQIVNKNKKYNDDQKMAEIATYIYALSITKFDTPAGEMADVNINDTKELLDNLNETLYNSLNDWYNKYDYGIKFKYKPTCRFCSWEDGEQDIPLTGFFF